MGGLIFIELIFQPLRNVPVLILQPGFMFGHFFWCWNRPL
jgi:hypothetical protein